MAINMSKQADIKLAFDALPAELHSGAEGYYREIGVWPQESK